jgi:hypothetical protein
MMVVWGGGCGVVSINLLKGGKNRVVMIVLWSQGALWPLFSTIVGKAVF